MSSAAEQMDSEARARAAAAIAAAREEEEQEVQRKMNKAREDEPVAFLSKLNQSVYSGGSDTLQDRLNKNKHYRQKGAIDQQGFI
jgi:hypothetical protein